MPRKNHVRGRRPQARRGRGSVSDYLVDTQATYLKNGLPQRPPKQPRPALLPMVEAEGRCATGKIRYGTPESAGEALRRARINREILQSPVVEERWYPQPGDVPCSCQGYHLTSAPRRTK